MSLLAHYGTCTRIMSCFGGLIEHSGYLVYLLFTAESPFLKFSPPELDRAMKKEKMVKELELV